MYDPELLKEIGVNAVVIAVMIWVWKSLKQRIKDQQDHIKELRTSMEELHKLHTKFLREIPEAIGHGYSDLISRYKTLASDLSQSTSPEEKQMADKIERVVTLVEDTRSDVQSLVKTNLNKSGFQEPVVNFAAASTADRSSFALLDNMMAATGAKEVINTSSVFIKVDANAPNQPYIQPRYVQSSEEAKTDDKSNDPLV